MVSDVIADAPVIAAGGNISRLPYREIWACDFEFIAASGEKPVPVCMVARELRSGRKLLFWQDDLQRLHRAPFDTGPESLFVAYYASAELGCFMALGWKPPERVLDLFTEFRAMTNGLQPVHGHSLLGALAWFGLTAIGADEKKEMRDLVESGGPWSKTERRAILDYCESDVVALERLLPAMLERFPPTPGALLERLGHALLRGRYMGAAASMECRGIPIDTDVLGMLRYLWPDLQSDLIREVDADFGVYDGRSFSFSRFEAWLGKNGLDWPRLGSGRLATDEDTFRQMARAYPAVAPLHELRQSLGQLRASQLAVGLDGRNRAMLSAFRSKTGRNQPSNSKFIFGAPRWLRGLIRPDPGMGLAYLDFSSQEIAIAAALSGDPALIDAYLSGDPYMAFAIQAGLAPEGATKATHKDIRNRCKTVVLGVGYGMSAEAMAGRAGVSVEGARELLRRHRETYRVFWEWTDNNVNVALAGGTLQTVFGWPLHFGAAGRLNDRSLLNFPMQANGAEMMRLACCVATEAGLSVCAPVHDALLLEAPLQQLEEDVEHLRAIMTEASRIVMQRLSCRVDAEMIRHPDRYRDEAGGVFWDKVMGLLERV
jgi:hypothetical protein